MNRSAKFIAAALCACGTIAGAEACAQSADAWKWQGSIYLYLPDIGGKTTFPQTGGGSDVGVDASKLLDNLDFAFMGSLEASNGRWGGLTDFIYLNIGNSKSETRELSIGGAGLPAGVQSNATYDLNGVAWNVVGTYRDLATPGMTMDLLAGARMLDVRQKLSWSLVGNGESMPVSSRSGSSEASLKNWDAIIGLKGRTAVGESGKLFVPYYADVGTGNSDLTWQAMAGVGYSFGWGDVVAAWRYLDYKMKPGKSIEDLTFSGPTIAAVFHW